MPYIHITEEEAIELVEDCGHSVIRGGEKPVEAEPFLEEVSVEAERLRFMRQLFQAGRKEELIEQCRNLLNDLLGAAI